MPIPGIRNRQPGALLFDRHLADQTGDCHVHCFVLEEEINPFSDK
jgi:hypothetical protein